MKQPILVLLPLLGLAACATGGNIHGDFDCKAPGGTCAPMGSIDASALASMGRGQSSSVSGIGIDTPQVSRTLAGQVIADSSDPQRTSDRVLRVVFPAHIDADGIYREESAAHAVVEASQWAEALGAMPALRGDTRLRAAGVIPATGVVPAVPPARALATLDEIIAARAAGAPTSQRTDPAGAPSSAGPVDPRPAAPWLATSAPAAAMRPPVVMPFPRAASRVAEPLSLAEAAAGLSAPHLAALDPRDPAANYDTPDVVAAAPQSGTSVNGASPDRAAARRNLKSGMELRHMAPPAMVDVAGSAAPPGSAAAPFGSRPVRWKGKTYDLPYRNPQPLSASESAAGTAGPNPTARLNREALEHLAPPPGKSVSAATDVLASASSARGDVGATSNIVVNNPSAAALPSLPSTSPYAPTDSARVAKARVQAMAAPLIARATDAGHAAALDEGGLKLPLPTTARGWSALAEVLPPQSPRAGPASLPGTVSPARPAAAGSAPAASPDAGNGAPVAPGTPQ
jgi:conjugal transfer pilus assembly protein TraV